MDFVAEPTEPQAPPDGLPAADPEEAARLAALHALGLLDTAPEERFDRIVALVRLIFEVPVAVITLVDADRQWIKAAAGMASGVSTARNYSPCHYTVQHPGPLTITDTTAETRVTDMTVVRQGIRFYAGQPLQAPGGERVGSLCIMDTEPRRFTADQQEVLAQMGQLVEEELAATDELAAAAAAQRALHPVDLAPVPGYELAGRCTPARRAAGSYFGWNPADGRMRLEVADVVGGGVSASVVAASARTLLRAVGEDGGRHPDTGRTASGIRALLADAEAFVTAFVATLDPVTGAVSYVLAGHGTAVVLDPGGGFRRLSRSGPALGLSSASGTGWTVHTTVVAPGETLLVLSDGFLVLDPDAQQLMDRTLDRVVERYPHGVDVHQAVDLVTAWAVPQGHPIDITALALHRSRCAEHRGAAGVADRA